MFSYDIERQEYVNRYDELVIDGEMGCNVLSEGRVDMPKFASPYHGQHI